MKWGSKLFAMLLILVGFIWSLQGANILPGSFMTGQVEWLVIGIICLIAGVSLLVYLQRQQTPADPE